MKQKVFASDFDGTLYFYKADVKLPPESVDKIREYQAAGHLFGLCTGRQVGGLTPFITGDSPQLIVLALRVLGIACLVIACAQPFLRGKLPRRGEGERRVCAHALLDVGQEARSKHELRQFLDRAGLAALAPEADPLRPERAEQAHRPAGKALRRGEAPGQRQLQHEICPACDSCAGTVMLHDHRSLSALHKVAAHDADDSAVRAERITADVYHILGA